MVTTAAFSRLERALSKCADELEHVKREFDIHVRRMAAMQAEIDRLRQQR